MSSDASATKASPVALTPLLLFLALFFGVGLYNSLTGVDMAFYQLRAPVALLPAMAVAVLLGRHSVKHSIGTLLKGIGHVDVITMCMVFLLAGAFATVTDAIGGVDATVNLGLLLLPADFLLPGLFLISGFIATAMGTSMGTVAAVAPIAIGLSDETGLGLALALGTVIGGAMFGDNLSIISDTTIAATRTQGCKMRDKFEANFWIAGPAALVTVGVLFFLGSGGDVAVTDVGDVSLWLVVPYLVVLGLALAGVNVLVVLSGGLALSGIVGFWQGYTLTAYAGDIYAGFESMLEIMLLSMFVGGVGAVMKEQGGLAWLAQRIAGATRRLRLGRRRTGEAGIAALSSLSNVFTANNTVAILLSGSVARDLADENGIAAKRSASLLDIFACSTQGLLPYGAQILLAGSLTDLSPVALSGSIYYCWILAAASLASIALGWPRFAPPRDEAPDERRDAETDSSTRNPQVARVGA